ncbi:MAG: SDR family oxidoreductase [Pseudomonadota bacterium]
MSGKLANKSILITGASTGIGRACALRAAQEGAAVTVADINDDEGQKTVEEIAKANGTAHYVRCDVAKAGDVQNAIASAVSSYERLDGAFNNAGISGEFTNIVKMSEENFDRTILIDLKGVWLCVKYQVEQFLKQDSKGAIVSTASVAGLLGTRGATAYCAAKHGVVGLTKAAALEYARKGIRVNAVCPGIIETPMLHGMSDDTGLALDAFVAQEPMNRLGEPREIGDAAVWLLSDDASFVTGIAMPVDGGYTAI